MKNRFLLFFLKSVVSGVLIYFVVRRVDFREASTALASANHYVLIFVPLISIIGIILSAYKWKFIIEGSGVYSFRLFDAIRYYAIGNFLSLFLPTSVGGDVFRMYLLNKNVKSASYSTFSILVERASGLVVMIAAVIISGLFLYMTSISVELNNIIIRYMLPPASLLLVMISLFGFFMSRVNSGWILRFVQKVRIVPLVDYWKIFLGKGLLGTTLLYSILFQSLVGAFSATIMYAFGIRENIFILLLISYVVAFLSSLPISFNGIGVREYAYTVLLGQLGYPASTAFAIGLSVFLIQVVVGIVGLLFYGATSFERKLKGSSL